MSHLFLFKLGLFLTLTAVVQIVASEHIPRLSPVSSSSSSFTDTWPYRFVANCAGYLWVILPLGTVVLLVKRGWVTSEALTKNAFIRLLVYGNDESAIPYVLLPVTLADIDSSLKTAKESAREVARQRWLRDAAKLAFCFAGLQVSYLTWGLLQEKIMTQAYLVEIKFFSDGGSHGHRPQSSSLIAVSPTDQHPDMVAVKFLNSQFIIFVSRLVAFFVGAGALLYANRRHLGHYFTGTRQPPLYLYSYCSLSNILSSWCQYEALKYVSFPVQVLSKGCKMIAVMLMSVCLRNKSYKRVEWLFAIAISFGIWLFLLNEEEEVKAKTVVAGHNKVATEAAALASASHAKLLSGILLLALYLTFDSFTSNWQSDLFERYQMSSTTMMTAVNLCSILFTSVSLQSQSEFAAAFRLLLANGALLCDCLILAFTSAIGQLFVYYTISQFGAVVFTLIMTLRQVFAILLSIVNFGHHLSIWGALGIVIVFGAIFGNMWYKYRARGSAGKVVRLENKAEV